ncbi:myosin heavy chain, clone 203-like [Haliotis cracherodii]|uniref:myosin heavy chain, clone 203-like n=1 Tax=Haliotis cracherodii TaxID=6455 RepID=UPI0039E7943C
MTNVEKIVKASEKRLAVLIRNRKDEIQESIDSLKLDVSDMKENVRGIEHDVPNHDSEIKKLREELSAERSRRFQLEKRVTLQEIRDRKPNLLIYGIPESPEGSMAFTGQNGKQASIPKTENHSVRSELTAPMPEKEKRYVKSELTASIPKKEKRSVKSELTASIPIKEKRSVKSELTASIPIEEKRSVKSELTAFMAKNENRSVKSQMTAPMPQKENQSVKDSAVMYDGGDVTVYMTKATELSAHEALGIMDETTFFSNILLNPNHY